MVVNILYIFLKNITNKYKLIEICFHTSLSPVSVDILINYTLIFSRVRWYFDQLYPHYKNYYYNKCII